MGISAGEIRIRRRELLVSAKSGADPGKEAIFSSQLYPSSFPWLKNVAKCFERFKWNRLEFTWRPAVGTTTNGLVTYGILWDPAAKAPDSRDKVSALTPVMDHPFWQSTENSPLTIAGPRLRARNWYNMSSTDVSDSSPGLFALAFAFGSSVINTLMGEIWVEYDIVLDGTVSAA